MVFSHICNADHMTGAEKYLLFLVEELSHHHQVILVVPNEGLLANRARETSGIQVQVCPYPLLWQMWDPEPNLLEVADQAFHSPPMHLLINMIHMHRPDGIIVNTCVNALPAMAASRLGIPVLWMITEVIRNNPCTGQAISIIDRYATWVGGISESTLRIFRQYGITRTLKLNPSWKPEQTFPEMWELHRKHLRSAYGVGTRDVLAGYIVSDIAPHKGFDHFVEMAIRLCGMHPDVQFMIVGKRTDQAYFDSTMNYLHQFGYASRFKLVPYIDSVETIYPALDLVVVPSLIDEGFGLTAMEGMIYGKPVIAYRSGGLEEILTGTGMEDWLVPQGDIARLTMTVHQLLQGHKFLTRIGRMAQSAVYQAFGIETFRARLGAILQAIDQAVHQAEQQHAINRSHIAEGSLLKGRLAPAVFLVQGGMKRAFGSEAAFNAHGLSWHQVATVDDALLQSFPNGPPIL